MTPRKQTSSINPSPSPKPASTILHLSKNRQIDANKIGDRDYRDALIYGLSRMLDEPELISEDRRRQLEALLIY